MPQEQSQKISNEIQISWKNIPCFSQQQLYQEHESLFHYLFFFFNWLLVSWLDDDDDDDDDEDDDVVVVGEDRRSFTKKIHLRRVCRGWRQHKSMHVRTRGKGVGGPKAIAKLDTFLQKRSHVKINPFSFLTVFFFSTLLKIYSLQS